VAIILIISTLSGSSPKHCLPDLAHCSRADAGFQRHDTGLVAGIQLSGNDMVRIGDWITMSKYGADEMSWRSH